MVKSNSTCEVIKEACESDSAFIDYYKIIYCDIPGAKWLGYIMMVSLSFFAFLDF